MEYFGLYLFTTVYMKKRYQEFFLFVYLQSYKFKSKFSFLQTVQSRLNTFYLRTSHFCAKYQYSFLGIIFFYTYKKVQWKNHVRFQKWNLKHTPQSAKNSFSRKSNLKFCIIFNMISFTNAQGSVKIRLACSKVLLLINDFDRISDVYKKRQIFLFYKRRQIFIFYKSRCGKFSLEIKLFIFVFLNYIFSFDTISINKQYKNFQQPTKKKKSINENLNPVL